MIYEEKYLTSHNKNLRVLTKKIVILHRKDLAINMVAIVIHTVFYLTLQLQ